MKRSLSVSRCLVLALFGCCIAVGPLHSLAAENDKKSEKAADMPGEPPDPQSNAISSAYTTAINQYMREDLKFGENWTYKPSTYGEPGFHWQMRYAEGGQNVMPDLAKKLKANPKTKVLLAGGYYDLATPFFEGIYEMHHLPIPQSLQANISYKYYQAGHMIYVNDGILKQFHDDVAAFIKATEAAK